MDSIFTLRRIVLFCFVSITLFSACTRISTTDIGGSLIPAIDGVITKDTLIELITDSFEDNDSVRIYKNDLHVIGSINNDPLFGKTAATMYFEMKPNTYPYFIPGAKDSTVADSAVLILSYQGFYGDSTQPLRLTVSEIDKTTPLDITRAYPANYPSAFNIKIGQQLAPTQTVDIRRLGDSVNNRYENAKGQIRIKLNSDIARRFIKTYDSTNAYISDSVFRTFFAGFALTTDNGSPANALIKLSLIDTNSKFALYYNSSSTGASQRDTSVVYFRFSSSFSGDANIVTRNRSGSDASKHFTTTSKPDSLIYIQTFPGSYARIRIPGLQSLNNRIIHRAELVTEQVPDDATLNTIETQMIAPRYLLLSRYDSAIKNQRNIPNDFIISVSGPNTASFGGYAFRKSVAPYNSIYGYNFDITRYVQGIVTRKDSSFTLRLSAPTNDSLLYSAPYPNTASSYTYYLSTGSANDVGDGRVRLGGGTHTRFRMRLRIIFSRI